MKNFIVLILMFGSFFSYSQTYDVRIINDSDFDVDVRLISVSDCEGFGPAETPWELPLASGYSVTHTTAGLPGDIWFVGQIRNPLDLSEWDLHFADLCTGCAIGDSNGYPDVKGAWEFNSALLCATFRITNTI